jgi:hypothetical protein
VSTPPREGDARTFGQPPSSEVNGSGWKTISGSVAPYVEGDFGLFGGQLHVVPGMRVEPYFMAIDRRAPSEGERRTSRSNRAYRFATHQTNGPASS